MSFLVDARWDGAYGIGRFGREIRRRLLIPESNEYRSRRAALDPLEIASLWRSLRAQPRGGFFYSPGFTGTFAHSGTTQLLTVWDLIHLQTDDKQSLLRRSYYRHVVRPALLDSGLVMTGSQHSAAQLSEWLGRRASRVEIAVVGCGISDEFWRRPEVSRSGRLVLVSGTQKHKNVRPVLEAIAAVPGATADWVVSDVAGAQALLRSTNTASNVTLRSGLSDMTLAGLYSNASALMFPSLIEGFGLPPIEAMACGTPVVYAASCNAVAETCTPYLGNCAVENARNSQNWIEAVETYSVPEAPQLINFDPSIYSWEAVASRVAGTLARRIGDDGIFTSPLSNDH